MKNVQDLNVVKYLSGTYRVPKNEERKGKQRKEKERKEKNVHIVTSLK